MAHIYFIGDAKFFLTTIDLFDYPNNYQSIQSLLARFGCGIASNPGTFTVEILPPPLSLLEVFAFRLFDFPTLVCLPILGEISFSFY